jgi:hypothetical protein
VVMAGPDDLEALDWDSIVHILRRPNFSRLQRLVIEGVENHSLEATKAWLANRLPASRARNIIVCRSAGVPDGRIDVTSSCN